MKSNKTYTNNEMKRIIVENNFEYVRCSGSHYIYARGSERIVMPFGHKGKDACKGIFLRYIKEFSLTIKEK